MPADLPLPASAEDLTAPWLERVLAAVAGGAHVADVRADAIGTGQVAETRRLTIEWDPPGAGPRHLVVKVPSSDAASLQAARSMRTYAIEVGFYRDLADTVDVHRPRCLFAAHDPDTDRFALVLEDLTPALAGDQLVGCGVDAAAACVDELVALHAPRWGDDRLHGIDWLYPSFEVAGPMLAALLAGFLDGFLERFADLVDPDVLALAERFVPRAGSYLTVRPGPRTIVHRDFRVDNLLFGGDRVAVVDWQTVSIDEGVTDLAYFLGGSLPRAERNEHERALVTAYAAGLRARGIDVADEAVWTGYRRFAFDGLVMAVLASSVVVRTDRGDRMFAAMAERAGHHAIDVDAEALLP